MLVENENLIQKKEKRIAEMVTKTDKKVGTEVGTEVGKKVGRKIQIITTKNGQEK